MVAHDQLCQSPPPTHPPTTHTHTQKKKSQPLTIATLMPHPQVGLPARASLCTERHEFVTQRVEYGAFDASAQDGSAAAAPAAEQAATEAAAAVTASVQPDVVLATVDAAQPQHAIGGDAELHHSTQQLKKQRLQ